MKNKQNPDGTGIVHGLICFIFSVAIAMLSMYGTYALIIMATSGVTEISIRSFYLTVVCILIFIGMLCTWNGRSITKLEKQIKNLEAKVYENDI